MTDAIRTPDELTQGLPDFPFEPRFRQWEGLRLAHVDEGDGPPVVFWHGEPTWSFLWRNVMPAVRDAGYRVIAPDLPGFGRSDKPIDIGWYSYDRHTAAARALVEDLDLREATFVVHDWGGSIGLRTAVELRDRVDRLVTLDSGVITGEHRMTDAWQAFRDFVERTEDLPVGFLVKGACARGLEDDVVAAYEAPFPTPASKAGARAFPLMLPTSPDMPGAASGRAVRDALVGDPRPKLVLWADGDPIIPPVVGEKLAALLGAPPPELIENCSHFLQEDAGEEIADVMIRWLDAG